MFQMALIRTDPREPIRGVITPEELEDILYDVCDLGILHGICVALDQAKCWEFRVSGFGDDDWGVDVWIDLCTIVEQLSDVTDWLLSGASDTSCDLDFYEQGVERYLTLCWVDEAKISITCVNRSSYHRTWRPDPETESLEYAVFRFMLARLAADFIGAADLAGPDVLLLHPIYRSWKSSVERL
ncbi:MAG: hypothetical protein ABIY70_10620 [Capsulimonas sp.]|uniref:hypothetical protein n=1 Tax=Capsulimonas sp. TaxID=2494211 RepID=UPI0032669E99